jgi:DNA-binding PadR family transcriptional regulator
MAELSDLENVVLGVVWKFGPLTPYAVRKEFLMSHSSHFSGSAGAIYPLMERLEGKGLISSTTLQRGERTRSLYRITRAGSAALRKWLRLSLPEKSSVTTYNPLRSRFYFLKALSPERRAEFLENAERKVREEIALIKNQCDRYKEKGETYSYLSLRNALLVLSSQLKWIAEVKEEIS